MIQNEIEMDPLQRKLNLKGCTNKCGLIVLSISRPNNQRKSFDQFLDGSRKSFRGLSSNSASIQNVQKARNISALLVNFHETFWFFYY
ncbi:unnamed protein product [Caenorhabditis angaria]|uniref:Uncharacterized protein n=1 Tax=Caenorhabditis angaria TaxID=860376 RepID=A0A9P1N1M1_9PELO|nr:unnamed protein product [Caenorhabditis angaria]